MVIEIVELLNVARMGQIVIPSSLRSRCRIHEMSWKMVDNTTKVSTTLNKVHYGHKNLATICASRGVSHQFYVLSGSTHLP
ncbi:hypothetical protein HanIR_Chr13g0660551 [Helianthus annuus]|nr:hypothetical protein HanIR_Chr13g0660551 [Helianthus annuus]